MTDSIESLAKAPHILLVDDHALFRAGLSLILQQHPDFAPEVYESGTASEAMEVLRQLPYMNLVLLDINMPGINGLDALRMLRPLCTHASIAILSATPDLAVEGKAHDLGADGFVSKSASAGDIQRIIRLLLGGHSYFPTLHTGDLSRVSLHGSASGALLTPRQLETLALMAAGHSNKVIARRLALSENTVRVHVSAVIDYFNCSTRMEAVVAARKLGILASSAI